MSPRSVPYRSGVANGEIVSDVLTNDDVVTDADCETTCGIESNNMASLREAALDECIYLDVHTNAAPDGEARGQLLRLVEMSLDGRWEGTTSQGLPLVLSVNEANRITLLCSESATLSSRSLYFPALRFWHHLVAVGGAGET